MPNNQPQILKGFLLAIAGYSCFSAQDTLIKYLSARYSIFIVTFYSLCVALALAFLFLLITRTSFRVLIPKKPKLLLTRSLFAAIASLCAFTSVSLLPLTTAYTLIFLCPIFLTLLAWIFLKEHVTPRLFLAVIAGFIGTVVVLRPGLQPLSLGMIAALGCALFYAVNMLILRRCSSEESLWASIFVPELFTALLAGIISLNHFVVPQFSDWPALAATGFLSLIGVSLVAYSFVFAPASKIAGAQYFEIPWGVLYGYLFWKDIPSPYVAVGAAFIVGSGLYIMHLNKRPAMA